MTGPPLQDLTGARRIEEQANRRRLPWPWQTDLNALAGATMSQTTAATSPRSCPAWMAGISPYRSPKEDKTMDITFGNPENLNHRSVSSASANQS